MEGATSFTGLLHFTLDPFLIILSVKKRLIKYHFWSLWYDSTWDWTPVSRILGEHFTHKANSYISCLGGKHLICLCSISCLELFWRGVLNLVTPSDLQNNMSNLTSHKPAKITPYEFLQQCPLTLKLCNVYRHRKWTRRYEFKSRSRLISFSIALIPLGKVSIQLFYLQLWVNSRADWEL